MAKIVDPDQLNQATEVVYSTVAKTVQYLVAGNLDDNSPGSTSGVTLVAGYSFAKEEWLVDANLNRHRFPYDPIFDEQFNMINGWSHADDQSRDLIRDAGWREVVSGREFMVFVSLGSQEGTGNQGYYQQVAGFDQTTTSFDKTDTINEPVEIFDGGSNDFRDFFKVYLREQGKIYSQGNLLVDQSLAALTYKVYKAPLGNSTDPNITASDATIDSNTPYTNMGADFLLGSGFTTWSDSTVYAAGAVVLDPIRQSGGSANGTWWFTPAGGTSSGTGTADDTGVTDWESYAGERQIGDEWFAYNRIIDGATGTDVEVYEWSERELRRTTDINDDSLGSPNQDGFGTVNGNVAVPLTAFVGTLQTNPGVFIDNLDANSRATTSFFDITVDGGGVDSESVPLTSGARIFPFSSAGNFVFNASPVSETNANTLFRLYFSYTQRQTATDVAVTSASGNAATLTSTNVDLSIFSSGDYFILSGFLTNSVNNGIMRATSNGSANSVDYEKPREPGSTLINETAGDTVNVDDDPFDTDDAIVVDDDTGTDITGQITQVNEPFTFAYDTNTQGSRTSSVDAPVVMVAQGLNDSKWGEASFTISRATGLNLPVNLLDELVYSNP